MFGRDEHMRLLCYMDSSLECLSIKKASSPETMLCKTPKPCGKYFVNMVQNPKHTLKCRIIIITAKKKKTNWKILQRGIFHQGILAWLFSRVWDQPQRNKSSPQSHLLLLLHPPTHHHQTWARRIPGWAKATHTTKHLLHFYQRCGNLYWFVVIVRFLDF